MIKLGVNGVAGRMGRQLVHAIEERKDAELYAACDAPETPSAGLNVSVLTGARADNIVVGTNPVDLVSKSDVIIDFTAPTVSLKLLDMLDGKDTRVVIGTTGFTQPQLEELHQHAQSIPVVFAPNYSVGVTVTLALLDQAARAFGEDYDVEIMEAHHRHKVDAPSGTAVKMGEVVANALGRDLDECTVYARQGITGERDRQTIGFATVRAGDIIGEHTVLFAGNGERIELTHRATDRMSFARGAVRASVWLAAQPPGLYDMNDVLGLARADT